MSLLTSCLSLRKFATASVLASGIKAVSMICIYYIFSIGLTFYNRMYMQLFKVPLTITLVHLLVKFFLCLVLRSMWICWTKKRRISLPFKQYITAVSLPGISSSLDIGLSNWGLEFITVSLYTMTKSTAILFILLFSILLKLEKPRRSLIFVIFFIALGLFFFTYHSTQFHLEGFLLVLGASSLSGVRWATAQLTMQRAEIGLSNPLDMIFHIQPFMLLTLLPLAVFTEGIYFSVSRKFFYFSDVSDVVLNAVILLAGAFLAFFMELSEFLLLVNTSSLTLSLSAIVKEFLTLMLDAKFNKNYLSPINMLGLFICFIGIGIHVFLKVTKDAATNNKDIRRIAPDANFSDLAPLLSSSESDKENHTRHRMTSSSL